MKLIAFLPFIICSLITTFAQADETQRAFQPVTLMKPLPVIEDAPIQTREELEGPLNGSDPTHPHASRP